MSYEVQFLVGSDQQTYQGLGTGKYLLRKRICEDFT